MNVVVLCADLCRPLVRGPCCPVAAAGTASCSRLPKPRSMTSRSSSGSELANSVRLMVTGSEGPTLSLLSSSGSLHSVNLAAKRRSDRPRNEMSRDISRCTYQKRSLGGQDVPSRPRTRQQPCTRSAPFGMKSLARTGRGACPGSPASPRRVGGASAGTIHRRINRPSSVALVRACAAGTVPTPASACRPGRCRPAGRSEDRPGAAR